MSSKRKREPTLAAPTLEEIGLPPARRQRTDASRMEDLSCEDVVESLREQGVEEDELQLFRGQTTHFARCCKKPREMCVPTVHKIEGRHLAGLSRQDLADMGIRLAQSRFHRKWSHL